MISKGNKHTVVQSKRGKTFKSAGGSYAAGGFGPLFWLIHVIGWGIMFGFPFFFATRERNPVTLAWYMGYVFVPVAFMIVFYVNYFWLIGQVLFRKKLLQYVLLNAVLIAAVCWGLDAWMHFHFVHFAEKTASAHPGPPKFLILSRDALLMALTAGLSVAIRMTGNWYRMEAERKELERERAEAELKNLKNQLNPHFLFNTLNNIYSLIAFSPEKAQHAVHDLSRLLRYVLYDNNQNFVPFMKEIEFVNNYIALMKIRLPDRVKIETDIYAESNPEVAPLLFITLVENAFKHGVSPVAESFIHIRLHTLEDSNIICRVENSYFPKDRQDSSGSGIGLENLRKRLALLYPGRHILLAERRGNKFVAELCLGKIEIHS